MILLFLGTFDRTNPNNDNTCKKKSTKINFRPSGGVGFLLAKGWWPKSSCSPSKVCLPWVIWDVPKIRPGCPGPLGVFKKFVLTKFVRIFRPLFSRVAQTCPQSRTPNSGSIFDMLRGGGGGRRVLKTKIPVARLSPKIYKCFQTPGLLNQASAALRGQLSWPSPISRISNLALHLFASENPPQKTTHPKKPPTPKTTHR